jgi:hypothetical protein
MLDYSVLFFSTYFFSSENFRGSNNGFTYGFHALTVPNDLLKSNQLCLNVGHCVPLTLSARFIRNSSQISLENISKKAALYFTRQTRVRSMPFFTCHVTKNAVFKL